MLPNLIVIGARKSGTTSLHNYLGLHPEVSMSSPKELDFFTSNWHRGVDWYESMFDSRAPVRGESSPTYTAYPYAGGVPEKVRSVLGEVRLIYLVRDPVERMVSEYTHRWSRGWERRPVGKVFGQDRFEASAYVAQSSYRLQLERYLEHFDLSQILVVDLEDLRSDPAATMEGLFRFLRVDPSFSSDGLSVPHNAARSWPVTRALNLVTRRRAGPDDVHRLPGAARLESMLAKPVKRSPLEPDLCRRVAGYLEEDAEGFRQLTGRSFPSWSV